MSFSLRLPRIQPRQSPRTKTRKLRTRAQSSPRNPPSLLMMMLTAAIKVKTQYVRMLHTPSPSPLQQWACVSQKYQRGDTMQMFQDTFDDMKFRARIHNKGNWYYISFPKCRDITVHLTCPWLWAAWQSVPPCPSCQHSLLICSQASLLMETSVFKSKVTTCTSVHCRIFSRDVNETLRKFSRYTRVFTFTHCPIRRQCRQASKFQMDSKYFCLKMPL